MEQVLGKGQGTSNIIMAASWEGSSMRIQFYSLCHKEFLIHSLLLMEMMSIIWLLLALFDHVFVLLINSDLLNYFMKRG